jgi:hypothetical protein
MEILRHSIKQLAAPICAACNVEMAWSRSTLTAADHVVIHIFACRRCGGIGKVVTPMKANRTAAVTHVVKDGQMIPKKNE